MAHTLVRTTSPTLWLDIDGRIYTLKGSYVPYYQQTGSVDRSVVDASIKALEWLANDSMMLSTYNPHLEEVAS